MFILIVIVSVLVSAFGSLVGFGGGVFLVPILVLFFDYSMAHAVGAVIVSLLPSSIINTFFTYRQRTLDLKTGVILEIPTIFGVGVGSYLLSVVSPDKIKIIFILLIFGLSLTFFGSKKNLEKPSLLQSFLIGMNRKKPFIMIHNIAHDVSYSINLVLVVVFGLLSGLFAGLFGVGGGFLKTPIMIKAFRIPAKIAAGTAIFMILITSFIGSVSHFVLGHVVFKYVLPVMIGFSIGPILVRSIHKKVSNELVERLVGVSLALASAMMAADYFFRLGK